MSITRPDDETLMAYADGMLPPEDMARTAALVEADQVLARRVAEFRASAELTRSAVGAFAGEPLPLALEQAIRQRIAEHKSGAASVVSLAARQNTNSATRPQAAAMAMAAGVAGLIIGALLAPRILGGGESSLHLAASSVAPQAIEVFLQTGKSGEETSVDGGRMKIVSTFRTADRTLCREYEIAAAAKPTIVALACWQDGSWQTRLALAAEPQSDGYAPASALEIVETYLTSLGAGAALTSEEEAAALAGR